MQVFLDVRLPANAAIDNVSLVIGSPISKSALEQVLHAVVDVVASAPLESTVGDFERLIRPALPAHARVSKRGELSYAANYVLRVQMGSDGPSEARCFRQSERNGTFTELFRRGSFAEAVAVICSHLPAETEDVRPPCGVCRRPCCDDHPVETGTSNGQLPAPAPRDGASEQAGEVVQAVR